MKLTELKCTACGGSVKQDPENPRIVECEYCHSRFIVESEHGMTPVYTTPVSYTPVKQPERKEDGEFRWKHGVLLAVCLLGAVALLYGPRLYKKYQEDQRAEASSGQAEALLDGKEEQEEEAMLAMLTEDPTLSAFCETVFSKPADQVTEAERAQIKWLEFSSDIDNWLMGYSLESPTENRDAKLTWIAFPRDHFQEADISCISAFPGLAFVGCRQTPPKDALSGLPIAGIKGHFQSLDEVAELAEDPAAITWIDMTGDVISLSGIEKFPNLNTLVIDGVPQDEKLLVQAPALKSLSLDLYDGEMDFTTAAMVPGLDQLTISCNNLRDISFVSRMKDLKALHLEDGIMLSVEALKDCPQLTELTIENCDEIKDLSPAAGLTNMKKLSLELPYDCPEPDLSALSQLEELRLSGFEQADFLAGLTNLKSLTLDSCYIENSEVFSGLVNLKSLSCTSFGAMQTDYSFIQNMTGLETVDLHGTETYDDLSGIFNLPALKSLNISGMSCEINFDNIAENTSLKELSMDHMRLYKNVEISGGNGIYSINYDDVNLAENLSFLGKLKGLEKLSLKENQLTDISFSAELPALQTIDFSENYVADVSALSGLKNLKTVIGTNNPVSNYEVLGDSVIIFE